MANKKPDLQHLEDAVSAVDKVIKKIEQEKLRLPNPRSINVLNKILDKLKKLKAEAKQEKLSKFEKQRWD